MTEWIRVTPKDGQTFLYVRTDQISMIEMLPSGTVNVFIEREWFEAHSADENTLDFQALLNGLNLRSQA